MILAKYIDPYASSVSIRVVRREEGLHVELITHCDCFPAIRQMLINAKKIFNLGRIAGALLTGVEVPNVILCFVRKMKLRTFEKQSN